MVLLDEASCRESFQASIGQCLFSESVSQLLGSSSSAKHEIFWCLSLFYLSPLFRIITYRFQSDRRNGIRHRSSCAAGNDVLRHTIVKNLTRAADFECSRQLTWPSQRWSLKNMAVRCRGCAGRQQFEGGVYVNERFWTVFGKAQELESLSKDPLQKYLG